MRIWLLGAPLLGLVLLFAAGCGGDRRHDIVTGEDGSLEGLTLAPLPQTLDIDDSEDFTLLWRNGYYPPREFRVKLEEVAPDGDKTPVYTDLETERTGYYILKPSGTLDRETFLLLTVSSAEETVRAMYLTEEADGSGGLILAPERVTHQGKVEHTVKTP